MATKQEDPVLFTLEKNIYLESAVSFVQYLINISPTEEPRFRLLTLIGERHMKKFECGDKESISVAEYVTNYVDEDPNTMVLLEMDEEQYSSGKCPKSVPIKDILTKKNNNDESYHKFLKYYDPRNLFLGSKYRYELYSKTELVLDDKELWNRYGEPFFQKWTDLTSRALSNNSYGKDQREFLTNILTKSIEGSFKNVYNILHSEADSSECVHNFRLCWLKVTDWFIMSFLMDNSNTANTAIAIMGNLHLTHIVDEILLTNGRLNDSRDAEDGDCVNLFKSVKMKTLINNCKPPSSLNEDAKEYKPSAK